MRKYNIYVWLININVNLFYKSCGIYYAFGAAMGNLGTNSFFHIHTGRNR